MKGRRECETVSCVGKSSRDFEATEAGAVLGGFPWIVACLVGFVSREARQAFTLSEQPSFLFMRSLCLERSAAPKNGLN